MRFLHNPKESQGYVGTAVGSSVFRYEKLLAKLSSMVYICPFVDFTRITKDNGLQKGLSKYHLKMCLAGLALISEVYLTTFITRVA